MSEDDLKTFVIQYAKYNGWMVAHFRPAQTKKGWRTPIEGDRGFPDLVLARDGEVRLVELKSDRGRLGPGQKEWGVALDENYRLWRPKDIELIKMELKRRSNR